MEKGSAVEAGRQMGQVKSQLGLAEEFVKGTGQGRDLEFDIQGLKIAKRFYASLF